MNNDFKMPGDSGFLNQSHLMEMTEPAHETLLDLIRASSSDPDIRTTMATSLVMSVWQHANTSSLIKPSLVLVNTADTSFDPVMSAIEDLLDHKTKMDPIHQKADGYVGMPAQAQQTMSNVIDLLRAEGRFVNRSGEEKMYHNARRTAYGLGSIHNYSKAWHPKLNLVTDKSDTITLLVKTEADKKLFRKHLLKDPHKVSSPSGIGTGLTTVCKSMQVSASFSPSECDDAIVDSIMELGRPYIILPHLADKVINIPNVHSVSHCINIIRSDWRSPVTSQPVIPDNYWCRAYQNRLWTRLSRLPMAYRYPILDLVHQLEEACAIIVDYTGITAGGVPPEKLTSLKLELYAHSLRGITMSMISLGWYGLGLTQAAPLQQTRKLLHTLREKGSMTLRDIQRTVNFKTAVERDSLVYSLVEEGLLKKEGKVVSATSYSDYIRSLPKLHRLPDVADLSQEDSCE